MRVAASKGECASGDGLNGGGPYGENAAAAAYGSVANRGGW